VGVAEAGPVLLGYEKDADRGPQGRS
jgi:hypothetical protein